MASQHGWFPIILEGDSQVILQMENKHLHGRSVSQVAKNWKMTHSLKQLVILLRRHLEVQCHHVRRKENKLVDLLANYGAREKQEYKQKLWADSIEEIF